MAEVKTITDKRPETPERERVHVVLSNGWVVREDNAVHWLSHGDGSLEMVGGSWRKLPAGFWASVYRGMPDGGLLIQVAAEVVG